MKQPVFYTECYFCIVGASALVVPTNHPEEGLRRIVNGQPVHTSRVLGIIESGPKPIFETLNSIYSPIEKWQAEREADLVSQLAADNEWLRETLE
jgi:hypothetical protein